MNDARSTEVTIANVPASMCKRRCRNARLVVECRTALRVLGNRRFEVLPEFHVQPSASFGRDDEGKTQRSEEDSAGGSPMKMVSDGTVTVASFEGPEHPATLQASTRYT